MENAINKIKAAMNRISGSGLDYEYEWSVKGSKLVLKTYYHVMNDCGYYVSVIPVTVWFPLDNPENFRIRCRNTGRALGIRDMLTVCSVYGININVKITTGGRSGRQN